MEFRDYLSLLEEMGRELDALCGVESRKLAAVQAGDLEALDACMKQEQAAALSLRGRERHRQQMLQALGLENVPLRELPQRCPPEDKARTEALAQQILRSYEVLSSAQGASRSLMESALRQIQNKLDGQDGAVAAAAAARSAGKTQKDFRV